MLDGITLADLLAPTETGRVLAGLSPHLIPLQFAAVVLPKKAPASSARAARSRKPAGAPKRGDGKTG